LFQVWLSLAIGGVKVSVAVPQRRELQVTNTKGQRGRAYLILVSVSFLWAMSAWGRPNGTTLLSAPAPAEVPHDVMSLRRDVHRGGGGGGGG